MNKAQTETARKQAFAAGYKAAMQEVRAVAAKAPPSGGTARGQRGRPAARATGRAATRTTTARATRGTARRGRPRAASSAAARPAAQRGRRTTTRSATRTTARTARPQRQRRAGGARPQRGNNARMIEEILQAIAPRAARPTEIRQTLQRDKGVAMAFTSIRHALGQLAARQAVEQVGDSNTWRHRGGGSSAD